MDINNFEYDNHLDINNPETVKKFDDMFVDFYLEDDMFEVEGQFFTVEDDENLYIEVHDAVMHILEMAGKELRCAQVGQVFTATRPDNHRFYMEINRVYYKVNNPEPADFVKYQQENDVNIFFLKLTDVMIKYKADTKKWCLTKNKINMHYLGDQFEYDTIDALYAENKDDLQGEWQFAVYEAYEEESDFGTIY